MSAVVTPTRTAELDAIASRIRERIKRTTADVIATGNDLLAAKKQLSHGAWLPWLDAEFGWAERTARNYISAAQFVEGKSATVADLPPATVYLLASPSTPSVVKDEVLAAVEAKKPIDPRKIEARIKEARQKAKPKPNQVAEPATIPLPKVPGARTKSIEPKPTPAAAEAALLEFLDRRPPDAMVKHGANKASQKQITDAILKVIDSFVGVSPFVVISAFNDARDVIKARADKAVWQ